jgi:hypothetical protein
MIPSSYLLVVCSCLLGLTALFLFGLGLWGVVTRKPFLISARWFLGLVLFSLVPGVAMPLLVQAPAIDGGLGPLALMRWLNPLVLVCVIIFMCFTMRGYFAFAITDASFREGLLAALHKLGMAHEEMLGSVRLPSVGADLQVAVQSWVGIGQLKVKQRSSSRLLRDIVRGMNEYYRTAATPINLTGCVFYLILGVLMAGLMGVLIVALGGTTGVPALADLPSPRHSATPFDIGPSLHQMGRPALWHSQSMALGDTGFVAHVGPTVYENKDDREPDYYSIDVEKAEGVNWQVYFERDLRIDELPEGFDSRPINEIVSYDSTTRKVTFAVGAKRFEYRLPEP